jgi:hypothetical protein
VTYINLPHGIICLNALNLDPALIQLKSISEIGTMIFHWYTQEQWSYVTHFKPNHATKNLERALDRHYDRRSNV